MKKMFTYIALLFLLVQIGSCSKDSDGTKTKFIEISVKDDSGAPQSGARVYVFENPSTEPSGVDPAAAIKSLFADANGVVTFEVESISALKPGVTYYFTVIGKSFSGANQALGSVDITIDNKEETVKRELVVSAPDPGPGPGSGQARGFTPTTIPSTLAMEEYNRWKTLMLRPCNNGIRLVAEDPNVTLVEAVGFGMLLSAYANDRATFDGIFTFYNSKRTPQAKNLMAWSVTCSGINDTGNATDGDVDVAFALIVADKQWGGTYLESAKGILQIIKDNLIVQCTSKGQNVLVLGPGYNNTAWGGCGLMDIMYHTPAFFRVFAQVTGDNTWEKLANDTYVTLNAGAHPTTGLVPDWQTSEGVPGPQGRVGYFGYDACRAPWRLTLDYLWNGNTSAEAWAKKVATWASQVGPSKIVDGYELNGTPRGTNGLNSAFLGGFAVATMAHSQSTVDQFGTELAKLRDTYWFNLNTRCLYLFTLTGKFWDPTKK